MAVGIEWLRSVEFDVRDVVATTAFYEDVWGLEAIARVGDSVYLRGSGAEHHLLVLRQQPAASVRRVNFGVAGRQAVDALHAAVNGAASSMPAELSEPGGGYGFAFLDSEGREFRIVADLEQHEPRAMANDVPVKLSHVLFDSTDPGAASAFFGNLGFRVRDRTSRNVFLGCNADHHCFGFGLGKRPALSHVAFELPSIDGLMRGVGRLKRNGLSLEWGVGRHGPGDNVFAYFLDPNEFAIEYTTEMEQVDDARYQARGPEFWDTRVTSDAWGVAGPASERFRSRRGPAAAPAPSIG